MSTIDAKRIAAVKFLRSRGYVYTDGAWCTERRSDAPELAEAADAMHAVLMQRADALAGCTEASDEEAELRAVAEAIDAYQAARLPTG